jgi:hypothetical protein
MRSILRISLGIMATLFLTSASLLACSGEGKQSSSGGCVGMECENENEPAPVEAKACSVLDVKGTIPGVSLSITSKKCVYHVGEAAEFTYEVKTDASVPPIVTEPGEGCGECSKPSEDPLSFVRYSIGGASPDGAQQRYCLCDVGCCAPAAAATTQLPATTASKAIQWTGRNWNGPSDTNNPEGDFFQPGKYGVEVTFSGSAQGSVTATLPIEIVP